MSLTKVPLNAITAKRIGTTANTTSGANVVLLANVAPGSDLTSNTVNLFKGSFVDYEEVFNHAQGASFGYGTGGASPSGNRNDIDKYSFTSDGNATDIANLIATINSQAGTQSTTHGYASGGNPPTTDRIEKFPFSTDSPASDIANLSTGRYGSAGASSTTHGYNAGGEPGPYYNPTLNNVIDKFPFSASVNATDIGNLTNPSQHRLTGVTSPTHGYSVGGSNPNGGATMDKFSFAADGDSTDVGSLIQTGETYSGTGHQSLTEGYASGGSTPPSTSLDTIQKWSFATDGTATDVGELTVVRYSGGGTSSRTNGYAAGGWSQGAGFAQYVNTIDKFPFAADASATDVGDMTLTKGYVAGQQV